MPPVTFIDIDGVSHLSPWNFESPHKSIIRHFNLRINKLSVGSVGSDYIFFILVVIIHDGKSIVNNPGVFFVGIFGNPFSLNHQNGAVQLILHLFCLIKLMGLIGTE
jgi:hypothetical protein